MSCTLAVTRPSRPAGNRGVSQGGTFGPLAASFLQHHSISILLLISFFLLSGCATQQRRAAAVPEHPLEPAPFHGLAETNSFFPAIHGGMMQVDFDLLVRAHYSDGLLITEVAFPTSDGDGHPLRPSRGSSSSIDLPTSDVTRHLRIPGCGIYAFYFSPGSNERGQRRIGEFGLRSWRRWSTTDNGWLSYTNGGWSVFMCPAR